MSGSQRHALVLFSLFLVFLPQFLGGQAAPGGAVIEPTYAFTTEYDGEDQFYYFRFHVSVDGKEVHVTPRIPGIFAPDKKMPEKLKPIFKTFVGKGGPFVLLCTPHFDVEKDNMSVVVLARKTDGTYGVPLLEEDRAGADFLLKNDFQPGILTVPGGFNPDAVTVKEGILGFLDSATGKTVNYSFDENFEMKYVGSNEPPAAPKDSK